MKFERRLTHTKLTYRVISGSQRVLVRVQSRPWSRLELGDALVSLGDDGVEVEELLVDKAVDIVRL